MLDACWKEGLEDSISSYSTLSEETRDALLDKELENGEIAKCFRKIKHIE